MYNVIDFDTKHHQAGGQGDTLTGPDDDWLDGVGSIVPYI